MTQEGLQEKEMLLQIASLAGAINKYKQHQQVWKQKKSTPIQRPPPQLLPPAKRQKIQSQTPAEISETALMAQIASLAGTINKYKQKQERQEEAKTKVCKYSFSRKRPSLTKFRRSSVKPSPFRRSFKRSKNKTLIVTKTPTEKKDKEKTLKINGALYKMSADRRTLQRIGQETKTKYVPRSVNIQGVNYVKALNGRSLVRSGSAASLFASRKKRESILNARKGKKASGYCLFFNKYGKCKNGTKCRYIHDPSKVAVCRKFIKGACHDPNCLLSHDTSNCQQTMPVCYHFLRGVCNNENCPYSHVYVNPNAQVCQAFLKGYCPDGTTCKLKHTNECQAMQQHGVCRDEKCKLIHRKRRNARNTDRSPDSEKKESSASPEPSDEEEEEEEESLELGSILPNFIALPPASNQVSQSS